MSMQWVRNNYGVPAKRGGRVEYAGATGTITGTRGPHLLIRLYGQRHSRPYHPTWQITYLPQEDGR